MNKSYAFLTRIININPIWTIPSHILNEPEVITKLIDYGLPIHVKSGKKLKKDDDQTEKHKTAIVPKTLPDVGIRQYQM